MSVDIKTFFTDFLLIIFYKLNQFFTKSCTPIIFCSSFENMKIEV